MTRSSFTPRLAAAMAAALLFSSIGVIDGAEAEPVEVTVLTSVALTSALDELAPQFERTNGNRLKIGYSLIADIKKRIIAGETADVIILSRPAMDDLQKQDKFVPGSIADVAGKPVG
jgi:molybdate transport system substrate-binding protein